MRLLLVIALFITTIMHAQVPGYALKLSGAGQYVSFGEVLHNVRTVSFWIKPTYDINTNIAAEIPILVRDENDPANLGEGEFAIFFGKSGTPHAGRITFTRATANTGHTIHSDATAWMANRWYHVAAVIDNQLGLRLYINGVLQQDTDPSTAAIYFRNEGPTGALFLGKWGVINGYGLNAEIDELRFYAFARNENSIKAGMCNVGNVGGTPATYYDFDIANALAISPNIGNTTGVPTGISLGNFLTSNAPVGNLSTFLYDNIATSALSISSGVVFNANDMNTNAAGVHLYANTSFVSTLPGNYPTVFGIWFTDTSATYNATFTYPSANCDSCAEIRTRDHQIAVNWNLRNVYPNNCSFYLPNESPPPQKWREEYWVRPNIPISTGLPDTISECEGYSTTLSPTEYAGARYLWDNGSTNRTRNVDSTGSYTVTINWHGCSVTKTVYVKKAYRPYFTLPNDTAICAGDTLIIRSPLNIDSAQYLWNNGQFTSKQITVYYAGTFTLMIWVGNCYWADAIRVDVIKHFPLELGPDTTLCLGQPITLTATEGLNYLWSDGSTGKEKTIYNQPQKVWVTAWNDCFERSDTINIDYEDCDCEIFLPNAFTPNQDEKNEVFAPRSSCYFEVYQLQIFNRWGNLIFESDQLDLGWDGTFLGTPQPEGVYSYQIRYKKFTWQQISSFKQGTLYLVR